MERPTNPFGVNVEVNRELQRMEHERNRGLENLLVKVARAWQHGDDARAVKFLGRVAGTPYDRHAQLWPGAHAAHMLLFELLTHTLETAGSDELAAWGDAVEATRAALDDEARQALLDAVVPVLQDWDLPPALARRVRRLVGDQRDEGDQWFDPSTPTDVVRRGTEASMRAAARAEVELADRGLCSHLEPEYW